MEERFRSIRCTCPKVAGWRQTSDPTLSPSECNLILATSTCDLAYQRINTSFARIHVNLGAAKARPFPRNYTAQAPQRRLSQPLYGGAHRLCTLGHEPQPR